MEVMYWLAVIRKAKAGDKEAKTMLQQTNEARAEKKMPSVEEELEEISRIAKHPYINNPQEKDLNEILMEDGKETAAEWLQTQPEEWREQMKEAVYECLKKRWPLNIGNIHMTAREIDAERNPKGW